LAGVLLTPPGETWIASSARISTDIGNSPGSRVARHADAPWCIDGLTTAELRQVDMTNALLFAALLLALACLFAGVRFVLEHASVPNTPDLPSIWTTWPVQWLLRHPSVQQVLVHPVSIVPLTSWLCGCPGSKLTCAPLPKVHDIHRFNHQDKTNMFPT